MVKLNIVLVFVVEYNFKKTFLDYRNEGIINIIVTVQRPIFWKSEAVDEKILKHKKL